MRARSVLVCLLGLLLAAQPAFAVQAPHCGHHDRAAAAASAAGHDGHHAGMNHDRHDAPTPIACECDCRGAMNGCAHAAGSVAMGVQPVVFSERHLAEAPALQRAGLHASTRLEPPLRPPIRA